MATSQKPIVTSFEDEYGERCVDILAFPDGSFAFKLCRRDIEDGGRWTCTADHSASRFSSFEAARRAAEEASGWLTAEG